MAKLSTFELADIIQSVATIARLHKGNDLNMKCEGNEYILTIGISEDTDVIYKTDKAGTYSNIKYKEREQ